MFKREEDAQLSCAAEKGDGSGKLGFDGHSSAPLDKVAPFDVSISLSLSH